MSVHHKPSSSDAFLPFSTFSLTSHRLVPPRNDEKTAADYKIQGGSVLHLVLALRGGSVLQTASLHLCSSTWLPAVIWGQLSANALGVRHGPTTAPRNPTFQGRSKQNTWKKGHFNWLVDIFPSWCKSSLQLKRPCSWEHCGLFACE